MSTKTFIPIGEYKRDLPLFGSSGVSALTGYFPYGDGFISMANESSEPGILTTGNFTIHETATPKHKYFQVNSMHVHPTQVVVSDGGVDSIYPNVADLFIGGWGDIAIREDFLGQFGTPTTTNVTRTAADDYGKDVNDPRPWSFASWSWDSVVATNYSDVPQIYYYGGSGKFTNMITDATGAMSLRAMHAAILGKHVVLANINFQEDDLPTPNGTNADCLKFFGDAYDHYHPDLVWWSATDDETLFGDETNNPGVNTGFQAMNETPGSITAICQVGDRALAIFKPNAIHLMELTGSDELFHFSIVSSNIGTIWPKSVVAVNRDVYFINSSGRVCVLRNGTSVEYVGAGKMNSFFGTFYGPAAFSGNNMPHYTSAAYAPGINSVVFQYKIGADSSLYKVGHLIYSIETDSFGDAGLTDISPAGSSDEYPADHPIASYSYDEDFYPTDDVLDGASYPGVVMYNPYHSFDALTSTYTPALEFVAASASYSVTGKTKRFSLGEQTVASPSPVYISSIRPVSTTAVTSANVFAYHSAASSSLIASKAAGSPSSNGWMALVGGPLGGQFFEISWSSTDSQHILGWEIEWSTGGKRS